MALATLNDLLDRYPAQTLAEAATDNAEATGERLRAHINGDTFSLELVGDPLKLEADLGAARRVLESALNDATAEIKGHVGALYSVELEALTPPPPVLNTYCIDIAVYRLLERHSPEPDPDAPHRVRYNAALSYLGKVAAGELSLDNQADEDTPGDRVDFDASPPVFGKHSLAGF